MSERLLTFWVVEFVFFWCRFALVTVGRASLPYLVWYIHRWKQLRFKLNIQRLYKEYTILWFDFDLCGLWHQKDATDPTLDNDTGSERTFQIQEQVRDDITGRDHKTDNIVRIMHWRWYLPDKNQERVQMQNLPQEYVNYALPIG